MNSRNRLIIILTTIAGIFLAGGGWLLSERQQEGGPLYSSSSGTPQVGGPFEMVRHDGVTVTDADYRGRNMLIFFGFTFCPDVCPTELSKIAEVMDILGDDAQKVVPIFVSVDPGRDTPEAMADYVSAFHDDMVGLTGSQEQVNSIAKAFKVYHKKVITDPDNPQDYGMDHSSVIYLMGPDGKFVAPILPNSIPDQMAALIKQYI